MQVKKFLVEKGATVALGDESLEHNCSTIWCRTERIALMVGRKIMPSYPKSLYGSMPRLINTMVDAQGGHT